MTLILRSKSICNLTVGTLVTILIALSSPLSLMRRHQLARAFGYSHRGSLSTSNAHGHRTFYISTTGKSSAQHSHLIFHYGQYTSRQLLRPLSVTSRIDNHGVNAKASLQQQVHCSSEDVEESMLDDEDLLANMTLTDTDNEDEEADPLKGLQPGVSNDFYIVAHYPTSSSEPFELESAVESGLIEPNDIERLKLTPTNISLPVALMILNPEEFPTQSKARKACRKSNVLIHRGPLKETDSVSVKESLKSSKSNERGRLGWFDPGKCRRGNVGDRVYPGGA